MLKLINGGLVIRKMEQLSKIQAEQIDEALAVIATFTDIIWSAGEENV